MVGKEVSRCVGWYLVSKWGGVWDGEVYWAVSTALHETLWFWQGSSHYKKCYKGSWNWELPHIFQLSLLQQVNWWLKRQVLKGNITLSPCVGWLVGSLSLSSTCKSESYIPVSASPSCILWNLIQHLQVILVLGLYVRSTHNANELFVSKLILIFYCSYWQACRSSINL